jgi:hypothetical protein
VERTSNSDQIYSADPCCFHAGQPIGHKGCEGKIDGLPLGPCSEMSPLRLPRQGIICCTAMYRHPVTEIPSPS